MEEVHQAGDRAYEQSKVAKVPGGLWQEFETVAYHLTVQMLFYVPETINSQILHSGYRHEIITGYI
jgi:hypothetical protein